MTFDKDKYWERRNNTVKQKDADGNEIEVKKPLRGQGVIATASSEVKPSGNAPISFGDGGTLISKNRLYRRQRVRLAPKTSQLRKKGKRKKK